MLRIKHLHATVADKPILNGVSLHVPAGEVLTELVVEAQKPLAISLEGSVG